MGDGPDADPNHAPSDLTDARRALRNPDVVMFYKIWNGRVKPKVPAMKTDIARIDVWTVIHYVKTLQGSDSWRDVTDFEGSDAARQAVR